MRMEVNNRDFTMIIKTRKGQVECREARTILQKTIGLMFRKKVFPLFFDFGFESKVGCALHTFFMRRKIDIIFVNSKKVVVDIKTARPWRPCIMPKEKARYVIELPENSRSLFCVGEKLKF